MSTVDWVILAVYFAFILVVGAYYARRAGRGLREFFISGGTLPWWIIGTSMVATTFSTDTPNLVTNIVRERGVGGNWVWWAFLVTGMMTVFFYARLWRRADLLTDMEFYELRYSGRPAAFLRAFRALYLGVLFNVLVMASVTLAATKIGHVLFGLDKYVMVAVCGGAVLVYSVLSGFWGVVITDIAQFVVAMVCSISAAFYALDHEAVGGLSGLLSKLEPETLSLIPDPKGATFLAAFIMPIAVQWWSVWYPGSEPGGGSYIAQRMLAARDERHSLLATLWFNVAHYALRPWPWIIVALASLVVYPDLDSIRAAVDLEEGLVKNDLGYPLMLRFLPHGLLGLMAASLAGAYMSTIDTHLNWGTSYVVNDVYKRFLARERTDRHYVFVSRLVTVGLMILACLLSFLLESALDSFNIMLQVGAGTGLIYLVRWFWWRVNAWSEITAMAVSFAFALFFFVMQKGYGVDWPSEIQLLISVSAATAAWLAVTLLTPPVRRETLIAFYRKIRPIGHGWHPISDEVPDARPSESLTGSILAWFLAMLAVYTALFGTGAYIYGRTGWGVVLTVVFLASAALLFRIAPDLRRRAPGAGGR